jgi:hypothetical protein
MYPDNMLGFVSECIFVTAAFAKALLARRIASILPASHVKLTFRYVLRLSFTSLGEYWLQGRVQGFGIHHYCRYLMSILPFYFTQHDT